MADDPAGLNPYAAPAADLAPRVLGTRAPAGLRITAGVVLLLDALFNLAAGVGIVAIAQMWSEVPATILLFGFFLCLVAATSIAAAVFLFRAKRSGFVLLTGLLVGATEVARNLLTSRVDLMTATGLVAALLAVISAVSTLNREALARRAA